jgi:hypothetical protein
LPFRLFRSATQTDPDACLAPASFFGLLLEPPDSLLPFVFSAASDLEGEGEKLLELPRGLKSAHILLAGLDIRVEEEPGDPVTFLHRRNGVGRIRGATDVEENVFSLRRGRDELHGRNRTSDFLYHIIGWGKVKEE